VVDRERHSSCEAGDRWSRFRLSRRRRLPRPQAPLSLSWGWILVKLGLRVWVVLGFGLLSCVYDYMNVWLCSRLIFALSSPENKFIWIWGFDYMFCSAPENRSEPTCANLSLQNTFAVVYTLFCRLHFTMSG
jgi:hypothetical protein